MKKCNLVFVKGRATWNSSMHFYQVSLYDRCQGNTWYYTGTVSYFNNLFIQRDKGEQK